MKVTLEKTIATMQSIVKDTFSKAREMQPTGKIPPSYRELRLVQNKTVIENPTIQISAVELKQA